MYTPQEQHPLEVVYLPKTQGDEMSDDMPTVPEKWRPTVNEPVPVVRCTTIKANGERCKRWSLRGATQCASHGGRLPSVREHAAATVEAARLRIIDLSDNAVDVIQDLMLNSAADKIRLDAARDLLDRAGIKGAVEIDVTVEQVTSPADRARQKIDEFAARLAEQALKEEEARRAEEAEIVDAELEDEEDD